MTYEKAVQEHGKYLVDDYINGTVVPKMINPKLAPGNKLPHPYNLVLAIGEDVWSNRNKSDKSVALQSIEEVAPEDVATFQIGLENLAGRLGDINPMASSSGDSSSRHHEALEPKEDTAADLKAKEMVASEQATAIKNINKWHGEWDRKVRQYNSALSQSRTCQKTAGSDVEKQLAAQILEGVAIDAELLGLETDYHASSPISADRWKSAVDNTLKVFELIKATNQTKVALNVLFKLG